MPTHNIWRLLIQVVSVTIFVSPSFGTTNFAYKDNAALIRALHGLRDSNEGRVRLRSLGKTLKTNDVWMLEIGTQTNAPALLVVAGVEPQDLFGTEVALKFASTWLNPSNSALASNTVYIIPRGNPDAQESYFQKPQTIRNGNSRPTDDDHDGIVDEDGPEDLDGDGIITSMRIKDSLGEYIVDTNDVRLMIRADKSKGEVGVWKVYTEGVDNDQDEEWNEDGPGGVNINRNFPYNYKYFSNSAGLHPVSELESRAIADFVISRPNIVAAFTFGSADNLVQTPKGEAVSVRMPLLIKEDDIPVYRELGKMWREAIGLKKELSGSVEPGSISDWIYFQRGRVSLAARPWSPSLQAELEPKVKAEKKDAKPAASSEGEKKEADKNSDDQKPESKPQDKKAESNPAAKPEDKKETDNRNQEDRAFVKWLDQYGTNFFVAWKEYDHPDFPGKRVEIGGFTPYARVMPPKAVAEALAEKQSAFLSTLVSRFPRIEVQDLSIKTLEKSVYDVKVTIQNQGFLPTSLRIGNISGEVNAAKATLLLPEENILAGSKITFLNSLGGSGGSQELRYVIHSTSNVVLQIGSAFSGSTNILLKLQK